MKLPDLIAQEIDTSGVDEVAGILARALIVLAHNKQNDIEFKTDLGVVTIERLSPKKTIKAIKMQITFSEFNLVRNARGADAARFDIVDDEGESYWLWMSKTDIKRNIKAFPECKAELQKGLNCYG